MRKIIFSLLSIFSVHTALCADRSYIRLSPEEDRALEALYMHDKKGTLLEVLTMEHIDYYLRILPLHIKFLENERKQPSEEMNGVVTGGVIFTVLTVSCLLAFYNKIQQLMAGKLGSVWLSREMLSDLRSIKFSRAEKKKLDQISFENINSSFYGSYDKDYTSAEEKKIVYLGKRLALKNIKKDIFGASATSVFSAMMAGVCFYVFYNKYFGAMERDKRLLELLINEKERRIGNGI
jgi:hypothetical protein